MSHGTCMNESCRTLEDSVNGDPDCWWIFMYGVATISRLLKIIGLFCQRALQKRLYSAKETCNDKEPTNRSNPIGRQTKT